MLLLHCRAGSGPFLHRSAKQAQSVTALPALRVRCGIPDYKAPADYGVTGKYGASTPPSSGASVPSTAGAGAPPSYSSPSSYSMPDYSAPTADSAAGGGGGSYGGSSGSGGSGSSGGGSGSGSSGSGGSSGPWRALTYLFAGLVAAGGGIAYNRKGSQASVVASSIVAGALLLSALFMHGATRVPATMIALMASCTLGTYMGKGYMKTRKAFPQGAFTALSLILSSGYLTSIL